MKRLMLCSTLRVLSRAVDELAHDGLVENVAFASYGPSNDDLIGPSCEHVDLAATVAAGLKGDFHGVDLSWLTVDLIEQLSWAEALIYPMMERIDSLKSHTHLQRRLLYHYLLCFWSEFLERKKLDVVLFASAPHEVSDFVLYALCKHRKILTILINYTRLPGACYLSTDLGPNGMIRSGQPVNQELLATVRANLAGIRRDYASAIPGDSKDVYERALRLKRMKRLEYVRQVLRVPGWAARKAYSLARMMLVDRTPEKLRNYAQVRINASTWAAIKAEYRARTAGFVMPRRYVYFLLSFQPESTTSPLGDRFVDQHLAIAMLSKNLPPEYEIVVKEHPVQMAEFNHYNYLGRDANFYERLSQLPRVRFAPVDADHFGLLDGALLVASVNGSVGWESAVRRKPTIVFGDAWYQHAPGVFRIRTDADCAKAIARMLQNEVQIDDAMIDRYVDEFLSGCEYLCLSEEEARFAGIPFEFGRSVAIAKTAIAAVFDQNAPSLRAQAAFGAKNPI